MLQVMVVVSSDKFLFKIDFNDKLIPVLAHMVFLLLVLFHLG